MSAASDNPAALILERGLTVAGAPVPPAEPLYRLHYRIYLEKGVSEFPGAVSTTFPNALRIRARHIERMFRHGLPPLDCWVVPADADREVTP